MKTKIFTLFLVLFFSFSGILFSQVINDEFFPLQWYLNMPGNENTRADIRVLDAWTRTMGNSNQKIADIEGEDSGSNGYPLTSHEDLTDRITTQGFGLVGEHSTLVAGLLVANHNTVGIAGVNKFAQLRSYLYSDYNQWADKVRDARLDGNKIINISQGTPDPLPDVYIRLAEAYSNNIVTVVSVGNLSTNITYPAVYPGVIAVGSSTKQNTSSSWSNSGSQIEFLAPGGSDFTQNNPDNIYTTSSNGSYVYKTGTSLAAPLVSGAASLLLAYKPDLTNEDAKNILRYSCDKLQEMGTNDFTNKCGYGRINLKKAMQFLEPPYSLIHGNATLTKLGDNVAQIFTGSPVLSTGTYFVDSYKLSVDRDDLAYLESPMAWLPKGYSGANPNNCQEYLDVSTTPTSVNAHTFFYYVRTNYASEPINTWFPYNPSAYYTILGKSANITTNSTFTGNQTIEGTLTVTNGATLTIASGSNITFNGSASLVVNSGASLVVNPGSTVKFTTGSLTVNGIITANGTSNPINFTSTSSSKWGGIRLQSTAGANSIIKYCNISNANQGIYVGLSNSYSSNFPTVEYNTISYCNDGIYLYNSEGSSSKPLRFNTVTNSINGIRFEGLSGYSNYVWITDNTLTTNTNGIVIRYAHPRVFRNHATCNEIGVKVENYSYPKFAETQQSVSGFNRFADNYSVNLYANNHVNVWMGQIDEVNEGRYGGYNTLGSPDDAQNPWSPRFIQANQYSTVMANYSYFGSFPPVSWKLEKDGTSSIDYSVYLSWDPVPGSSCSASKFTSKEEDNFQLENKIPGDIADLPIGGFATKGVKRSIPSLLLYLGMHHYMNQNLDSAAMVFQKVINTYPDSLESLFALDLFTKMLYESNTDTIYDFISTFEGRFGLGNSLNSQSLHDASLPLLAGVHMRRNNPNAAIGIFNRINNTSPESENAKYALYSMLSYYLNVKKEVGLAENIYNRLSEKFPTDPILVDAMILMNKDPEAMLGKVSLSKTMNPPPSIVEKSSLDNLIIEEFALNQNYPNPFNPSTIIQYQIPIPGTVKLKIYDILGSEVVELVNSYQNEGQYRVTINLAGDLSLSSGMYYYVLDVSGINGEKYRNVKKMMVLK